jgi:hypothetical protein
MHVTSDQPSYKVKLPKQPAVFPETSFTWYWAATAAVGLIGGAVGAYLASSLCKPKESRPNHVRLVVTGGNSKAPDEKLEVLEDVLVDIQNKADPFDPRPRQG